MLQPTTEYNIRIDIHELRDLKFNDGTSNITPNPFVEIKVCNQVKTTPKQNSASSTLVQASYNFTETLTRGDFECSTIEINVMHAYILSSAPIGSHVFSFNYVYGKSQHWIYRNWIPLILGDRPSEITGFALVTVGIFAPGDSIPAVDDTVNIMNDNDQGVKITSSPEISLTQYNLSICIYKGQDIAPITGLYTTLEPFVTVRHGISKLSTPCIKNEANPTWKSLITLPGYFPCSDSNILFELWNGESKPTLIGKFKLDAFTIFKEAFPVTWVNIYWTEPPYGGAAELFSSTSTSTTSLVPSSYAGRILISASSQKTQACTVKSIQTTPLSNEPPMTRYLLWIDIYEISCRPSFEGEVVVEFCIGPHNITTIAMPQSGEPIIFDEQTGRLDETYFYLSDGQDPWDLFIYSQTGSGSSLWAPSTFTRASFTRVSLSTLIEDAGVNPNWYTLKPIYNTNPGYTFNLLASITILPANTASERPQRLKYSLEDFYFRSFIYEGMNFKGVGTVLPNPYVRISIGDQTVQSRSIKSSLVPQWYEAYEVQISLPNNLSLGSDILIEVYSQSHGYLSTDVRIGFTTYKLSKVPKVWKSTPEWLYLKPSETKNPQEDTNARILCSFELVSVNEIEQYPFYDDIRPTTIPADIRLFIIGVRMFSSLNNPTVSVSFGREIEESNAPLWHDTTPAPNCGDEGNWNYLHDFAITTDLPKRDVFQSYFEINVNEKVSGYSGESNVSSGFAILYFNSVIPWYDEKEKKKNKEFFHLTTLDELIVGSNDYEVTNINIPDAREEEELSLDNRKVLNTMKSISSPTNISSNSGPAFDPDASNSLFYPPIDLLKTKTDDDENTLIDMNIISKDDDQANMALKLKKIGTIFGFDARLLNFDLKIFSEEDETEQRFEIPYELEQDLDPEELPYHTLPIVSLNEKGLYYIVGYIKYTLCIIQQPEEDGNDIIDTKVQEETLQTFSDNRMWIANQYNNMKPIVARCYVLSARGLLPPSGDINPSVYIYIRSREKSGENAVLDGNGKKKRSVYPGNIRDSGFVRRQGYKPEFNQVYEIGCILPHNALVRISLIGTGAVLEEIIGSTFIDIEDRWFHPKIQSMFEKDTTPIEMRTLRVEKSFVSHGTLRAWYEIMSEQVAKATPITELSSVDPQSFQLRVVIWRVRHVPIEPNTTISLYVSGIYNIDELNMETQSTETHYNSKDGTGIFNWRFVFDIKIPAQYPIFKLQLWSYGLIQSEHIGDCLVDLSNEFGKAKKHSSQITKIPKTWFGFSHPTKQNLPQGQVELEIAIVPGKISDSSPVGKGREPPNVDPVLENVTENRTYVDWKGIGEAISSATSSIWSAAKKGFIIAIIIGIIALILFLMIMLN
ncbi:ferlin-like type II membrane [Cryptosporidium xiaoi]|uniref:Ferlin-like type II membrane n=1 Tax=Cryptosporidium xiaoi TaxID=659607 RepID=A0AAV9Y087_9CRYT